MARSTLKIGITGGIGSGKTTVCRIFESMNIPVYFADDRAKAIMIEQPAIIEGILDVFGLDAYLEDGSLNRPFIAKQAFSNKKKLAKLNALVHPAVGKDSSDWHQTQIKNTPSLAYTLKEAALLVENGSFKLLDKLIVVTAPEATRIKRVVARDKTKEADVRARIQNQLSEAERSKHADFIIDNSGSQQLIPQVVNIHRILTKLAIQN